MAPSRSGSVLPPDGLRSRPKPARPAHSAPEVHLPDSKAHPNRIGPFTIVDVLGEGGMGTVYRAEQTQPVRRTVALKVLSKGDVRPDVLARFDLERQALAVMDHPSIAKVFDAGVTEEGRPYFVMELVEGDNLIDYCDDRCLGVRDRVALFADVCRAVQHAHQKGSSTGT